MTYMHLLMYIMHRYENDLNRFNSRKQCVDKACMIDHIQHIKT